jgi:hypothetical protein
MNAAPLSTKHLTGQFHCRTVHVYVLMLNRRHTIFVQFYLHASACLTMWCLDVITFVRNFVEIVFIQTRLTMDTQTSTDIEEYVIVTSLLTLC